MNSHRQFFEVLAVESLFQLFLAKPYYSLLGSHDFRGKFSIKLRIVASDAIIR